MTRRIAVFTGSRAEYGLLYWLMRGIMRSATLELQVIAAAMHFAPEFGATWKEIGSDGFPIDARVEMLLASDSAVGVLKSMGLGVIGMADALDRLRPDALVVLGDRFETLAAAQSAVVLGIPLVHLHGGEITEGAYDDAFRHAITKFATWHFTATEDYRRRVIQLGESPDRVINCGALGLDHVLLTAPVSWAELCASLGFELREPYFLATYHPATNAEEDPVASVRALVAALDRFPDHQVVWTYPNADNGGRAIIAALHEHAAGRTSRFLVVPSLGTRRYLTILMHAAAVIGNSSSGIIEAPSLGVPTVDIGSRQRGRVAAQSVLHASADENSILEMLRSALSPEHRELARRRENPYGAGCAAECIIGVLETADLNRRKRFHDLEHDE
jgi:UDP-hydrolysing UDP-N-acetyl-D-glucosamine 2-epimerase